MKFVIFALQILIGIESALAIKCYNCSPDFSNFSPAALAGMGNPPTMCGKPNATTECTGPEQDSCSTITITGKVKLIGEVIVHFLNCSSKMACGDMRKNMTCAAMTNDVKKATVAYGPEITSCGMTCCQGDLCNNFVVPSPSVATSPGTYPVSSPGTSPGTTTQSPAGKTTVKSFAKGIRFQISCAIFGILGAISVAFMIIF